MLLVGAAFDLLFGFNHTDGGFSTLLFLFIVVPLLDLCWLVVEIVLFIRQAKTQFEMKSLLMPGIAMLIFLEAIAIDLYMVSQMRM